MQPSKAIMSMLTLSMMTAGPYNFDPSERMDTRTEEQKQRDFEIAQAKREHDFAVYQKETPIKLAKAEAKRARKYKGVKVHDDSEFNTVWVFNGKKFWDYIATHADLDIKPTDHTIARIQSLEGMVVNFKSDTATEGWFIYNNDTITALREWCEVRV